MPDKSPLGHLAENKEQAYPQPGGSGGGMSVTAEPIRPNHINLPLAPIYPRQQREGYGFRPASGQTTPTLNQGSSSAEQFGSASTNARGRSRALREGGDDEEEKEGRDDYDHMPDGQSMDALREGIKGELIKSGIVGQGKGIADEEGLGWPGKSISADRSHSPASVQS